METILPQQAEAIAKLQHYKVGALFMRPGTGKTRSAIELVEGIADAKEYYWLTPFQNKANLATELNKWAHYPHRHSIMGIETLSSSDKAYLHITELLTKYAQCAVMVVDESLKIKNCDAIRTKRIIDLGKLCQYKLILNGTPVSRNLLDLWAQMDFLSPTILNMGFAEFKNTFCEYTTITKRKGHMVQRREFINKYHNVDHLYSLIGHYVYEADLELNIHKQYVDVSYTIDGELRELYEELKKKYLDNEMLQWKNNNIFLELTQKLQHTYCCADDKFTVVDRIIKENDPAKCVIFCKYIASQEACRKRWPNVQVLSIQKHSLGLNLQQYNRSIIWDKTWDFATIDQMEHRTYRTGQQEDCIYYHLQGNVGLEELITKCVNKKMDLLDYLKSISIKELEKEL